MLRLSVVVIIAVFVIGGAVIAFGLFSNEAKVNDATTIGPNEELSAFEKLEKYRDQLIQINQNNIQVLDEIKVAQLGDDDDDVDEVGANISDNNNDNNNNDNNDNNDNNSTQIDQEIAVLEQVIAQNVKEIQEITEQLAEMVP